MTPARRPGSWRVDAGAVTMIDRTTYTDRVRAALAYIAAGDVYQVNLAHAICVPFSGSADALAAHLMEVAAPAHGTSCVFDDGPMRHAVVSLSPERFLSFDASSRTLVTEPMKGTRPAGTDPTLLRDARKDTAELNMIVDLMRNDLGRVAEPGSVRVVTPRAIRAHGSGVLQATATIRATANTNIFLTDILAAAFPPGSITGAPKIRAMQLIDALEGSARGPYCGSTCGSRPMAPSTRA